MSEQKSLFKKIINNVFPQVPDFFGMVSDQVAVLAEATNLLADLMGSNRPEVATKIRELEVQSGKLRDRNLEVLAEAFATPMDREDIYRAVSSVDTATNYVKTLSRELEILGVAPDDAMREMVAQLRGGVEALKRGYIKLGTAPATAEADCIAVSMAERAVEKAYRKALATLLDTDENMKAAGIVAGAADTNRLVMEQIMRTMKRREVYRHLSNTADQVAKAGTVLHDIAVQLS